MPILARSWWSLVFRGIVAILFGIAVFAAPGVTFRVVVLLFGAFVLLSGLTSLIAMFGAEHWGALFIEGIVGVAAGLAALFWPGITAVALVYIIAFWALITGAVEIAAAIRLRKVVEGEWLLMLAGILSVLVGILFIASPGIGALTIAMWIGVFAVLYGITLISLGFRLRSWIEHPPAAMSH
jgi:uncharacterized membrane protein HdeD (DUF308 family)